MKKSAKKSKGDLIALANTFYKLMSADVKGQLLSFDQIKLEKTLTKIIKSIAECLTYIYKDNDHKIFVMYYDQDDDFKKCFAKDVMKVVKILKDAFSLAGWDFIFCETKAMDVEIIAHMKVYGDFISLCSNKTTFNGEDELTLLEEDLVFSNLYSKASPETQRQYSLLEADEPLDSFAFTRRTDAIANDLGVSKNTFKELKEDLDRLDQLKDEHILREQADSLGMDFDLYLELYNLHHYDDFMESKEFISDLYGIDQNELHEAWKVVHHSL